MHTGGGGRNKTVNGSGTPHETHNPNSGLGRGRSWGGRIILRKEETRTRTKRAEAFLSKEIWYRTNGEEERDGKHRQNRGNHFPEHNKTKRYGAYENRLGRSRQPMVRKKEKSPKPKVLTGEQMTLQRTKKGHPSWGNGKG